MEAIDLGLSVKWGNCNLGATSITDQGDFYCWETIISETNGLNEMDLLFAPVGIPDEMKLDIAGKTLGDGWRVPTKEQIEELFNSCQIRYSEIGGKEMIFFVGPSRYVIALPLLSTDDKLYELLDECIYWSSTEVNHDPRCAYRLKLEASQCHTGYSRKSQYGFVRPVFVG